MKEQEQQGRIDRFNSRRIRLESISHNRHSDTAVEAVEEQVLPPFLLVLLARSEAPEPAAGWVVVGAVVVAGGAGRGCGEGADAGCGGYARGGGGAAEEWGGEGETV